MKTQIDDKVEREAMYQSFKRHPGLCPKCGGELRQSYQHYLIATIEGKRKRDSLFIGGDFGWFCTSCPIVLFNVRVISAMLRNVSPCLGVVAKFVVLGTIDWDAIPESLRDVPIGAPGNPIYLVKFRYVPALPEQHIQNRKGKLSRKRRVRIIL